MQLFIDSANIDEIKQAWDWGIIDGITTNPSLASKNKADFNKIVQEIFDTVDGPISLEVISTDYEGMLKEGRKLAKLDPRVVVKIPSIPDGVKAVNTLSREDIPTNFTLTFSANQALLAAKAGATYVSPFIGRIDDMGQEGMDVVAEILQIYENYGFETQVLAASIRHTDHVKEAAILGADIATCPFAVLEKMFNHPLTDKGLKKFLDDWKKSGHKKLV
ncbi:MAG TPA: fructose-6-phosphate aldolase [bacterium]|nr:fructose-6-phosphate aldolase [bacterium]